MITFYSRLPEFFPFTSSHYFALLFAFLIGWGIIWFAKNKLKENGQQKLAIVISLFIALNVVVYICIKLKRGTFDIGTELPFNICNLSALILPFVIWKKNRYLSGVLYFWIMAGTLQANLTPDLSVGFPHYFYFKYWVVHSGLVVMVMYLVFINGLKPNFKDFFRAVVCAQVYLVLMVLLNLAINGNYLYLMRKPDTPTVADYMGPWPWYILTGELLMIVLFGLLLIPFLVGKRRINEGVNA